MIDRESALAVHICFLMASAFLLLKISIKLKCFQEVELFLSFCEKKIRTDVYFALEWKFTASVELVFLWIHAHLSVKPKTIQIWLYSMLLNYYIKDFLKNILFFWKKYWGCVTMEDAVENWQILLWRCQNTKHWLINRRKNNLQKHMEKNNQEERTVCWLWKFESELLSIKKPTKKVRMGLL